MTEQLKDLKSDDEKDDDFKIFFPQIIKFLHQSIENQSLESSSYQKKYKGLDVQVSFGIGRSAFVPWMCFLKEGQEIRNGYYPGLYFDREISRLFVVLGVSEETKPKQTWSIELTSNYKNFGKIEVSKNIKRKYPNSFLFSQYIIDNKNIEKSLESEKERIIGELNHLIEIYKKTNTQKENETVDSIIISKIAWSYNGWTGFDKEGYRNRKQYGFKHVKKFGLAHEWWSFHDFGGDYYFGHIEIGEKEVKAFTNNGLILIASVNLEENNYNLVGFYGKAEWGKYLLPMSLWETLSQDDKEMLSKEAESGLIEKDGPDELKERTSLNWRGQKEYSTLFKTFIPFDPKDFGVPLWGRAPYIIVGKNPDKFTKKSMKELLVQALDEHKKLLTTSSETEKTEIESIIGKIERILEMYFNKTDSHNSTITMTSIPTNPLYTKIKKLLDLKGQIILYGPPGTGKTFSANEFIKNHNATTYDLIEKSFLDQRVFILTIYGPLFKNVPELKPGEEFTYKWKGTENWQCYFNEIQVGDTALTYSPIPLHKFTTVIRLIRKEEYELVFSVLHQFNGVTFQAMKSDPFLKESDLARGTMPFSLRRVQDSELQRIIELSSGLTYEDLGIVVNKTDESVKNTKFVTFHPSFGYEDFIEGLRPVTENEMVKYRVEEGVFKVFARLAFNVLLQKAGIEKEWKDGEDIPLLDGDEKTKIRGSAPDVPFYLMIDEINRGEISRIFGELITLIEVDKRYCEENDLVNILPYSKRKFAVPPNLLIIGTMNTADKSIALVDLALRRRFGFIEMIPDEKSLSKILSTENEDLKEISTLAIELLKRTNEKITSNYDRDHQIGHTYFIKLKDAGTRDAAIKTLHLIWYHEILPLLQEYYYDSPKKLHEIVGDQFVTLIDKRGFQFKETLYDEEFLNAIKDLTKIATNSNT